MTLEEILIQKSILESVILKAVEDFEIITKLQVQEVELEPMYSLIKSPHKQRTLNVNVEVKI